MSSDACLAAVGQPQCEDAIRVLPLDVRQRMACAGEEWSSSLTTILEDLYNVGSVRVSREGPHADNGFAWTIAFLKEWNR